MSDALLDLWADELNEALVRDLSPETVELIAAAASTSATSFISGMAAPTLTIAKGAGLATGGTGIAGLSTLAKVGVTTLALVAGTGVAAVTGALPDPVQTWIAGVVEEIGIDLPTPDEPTIPEVPVDQIPLPDLPLDVDDIPIPDLPSDDADASVPDVTLPTVTLPLDTVTPPSLP